jgi:RNA polymerase sigma factor (sigma-70 family)
MVNAQLHGVLRHLHGLRDARAVAEAPDAQLLEWFARGHEEAPFAALVRRHGPMVWAVSRRVLPRVQDAEDVFQATFLLLARKAASIRKAESVGGWLYGVARRLALKARLQQARRQAREKRAADMRQTRTSGETSLAEVQAALDAALGELPEHYRAALVLCYLEGNTQEEAARRLGCPLATLRTRVARGRKLLRERLVRHGLTLSAAGLATLLIASAAPAAAPAALVRAAVRAALPFAAGQPAAVLCSRQVAGLVEGGLRAMFFTKMKMATALVLTAGLVAGTAALLQRGQAANGAAMPPAAASADPPAAAAKPLAADEESTSTEVSGRVIDPNGKPVAEAKLYLLAEAKLYLLGGDGKDKAPIRARATTDQDGRFRLTATRDQSPLIAVADGYGPAWTKHFDKSDDLTLRLVKDDVPITGRILDLQGKPVAGVTLTPHALNSSPTGKLDAWLEGAKTRRDGIQLEHDVLSDAVQQNALADLFPRFTTDEEGRFRLKGFGRERVVALIVEGPAVETQEIKVITRAGVTPFQLPWWGDSLGQSRDRQFCYYGADFEHVSPPCRPVTGVVRDRATGKHIAGAVVRAEEMVGNPNYRVQTTTDADGRYRLTGLGKGRDGGAVSVLALPPEGQPYLGMTRPADGAGLEAVTLDFGLKKGVWVQGRVTDKATGRGVQALMTYAVFRDGLEKGEERELFLPIQGGDGSYSDKAGRFRFVGYPGRGLLGARATGAGMEHYRISVGAAEIKGGDHNGVGGLLAFPTFPYQTTAWNGDTWKEINHAPGADAMARDLVLEPGRALRVRVEGPDGQPLEGARVHGQGARDQWGDALPAEFPVYGLEEGKGRTLLFRHVKKGLAGLREIKADESGLIVVRLQPAASIRGRLLTDDGKPWRHTEVPVRFMLKERPNWVFDHAPERVRTDAEGRFRIDGLIPGLRYHAMVMDGRYPREVFADLTLASGQAKDLGDVTPKKARDAE